MNELGWLGRSLVLLGVVLVIVGAVLAWGPRIGWLGKLPGDFVWKGNGWSVYLPLGTCILISIVLSLILALWSRR
jgi:hypothetical protein